MTETEHRKMIWQGATKDWLIHEISIDDSKLDELRCAIGWLQSRAEFFEKHRLDLIVVLDDPLAYCSTCQGKLFPGYTHHCPQSVAPASGKG